MVPETSYCLNLTIGMSVLDGNDVVNAAWAYANLRPSQPATGSNNIYTPRVDNGPPRTCIRARIYRRCSGHETVQPVCRHVILPQDENVSNGDTPVRQQLDVACLTICALHCLRAALYCGVMRVCRETHVNQGATMRSLQRRLLNSCRPGQESSSSDSYQNSAEPLF